MENEQPRRMLPVWAVVKRAYAFPWEYRRVLFAPLAILTVAGFVLAVLAQIAAQSMPTMNGNDDPAAAAADLSRVVSGGARVFLIALVAMMANMSAVVGIHRLVLLGEIRRGLRFFHFDGYFGRYLLTFLLLAIIFILSYVIVILVLAVLTLGTGLFGRDSSGQYDTLVIAAVIAIILATIVVLGFTLLRLQLALPAAAVGAKDRLDLAWNATRHNVLRLLAVWFLTLLPIVVLMVLAQTHELLAVIHQGVQARAAFRHAEGPDWIVVSLTALVSPIQIAVVTTMLSLCYDVLVRGGGPPQAHTQGTVVE